MKALRTPKSVSVASAESPSRPNAVERSRAKVFLEKVAHGRVGEVRFVKTKAAPKAEAVVAAPAPAMVAPVAKVPVARKATPAPRRSSKVNLSVARGGPARGDADYEVAFPSRPAALGFLANQHGLTVDEQRRLARESRLKLNRRWHGSEACFIREVAVDPDLARELLGA